MLNRLLHCIQSATSSIILLYIAINFASLDARTSHALDSSLRQDISSTRCVLPELKNVKVRWKKRFKLAKFDCYKGYQLLGSRYAGCAIGGMWDAEFPVCAKRGCPKLDPPPNGFIDVEGGMTAALFCKETFQAVGNRKVYCDGENWDREIGTCRETFQKSQTVCDFETEDLCQWYYGQTTNFGWKRRTSYQANVINTGPKFDHTYQEQSKGHYMLLETTDADEPAHLISPIFVPEESVNACFSFHYFMSGASVGRLRVYVKPLSYSMDAIADDNRFIFFEITGNQRNLWHHETVDIDEFTESFQIVVEGSSKGDHLGDIAIDDVAILQGAQCIREETKTTQRTNEAEETGIIYDYQSCKSRCEETQPPVLAHQNITMKIIMSCACHAECEDSGTCCPDYRKLCAFGAERTPTDVNFYNTEKNSFEGTSPILGLPSVDAFKSTEVIDSGRFTTQSSHDINFPVISKSSSASSVQSKQIQSKTTEPQTISTYTTTKVTTRQTTPNTSPANNNVQTIFEKQTEPSIETPISERGIPVSKSAEVLLQQDPATAKTFDIQVSKTSKLENEAPDPAPFPILVIVLSLLGIGAILTFAALWLKYYYKNSSPDSYKKSVEIANRREQEEFSDVLYLTEQINFTMQTQPDI